MAEDIFARDKFIKISHSSHIKLNQNVYHVWLFLVKRINIFAYAGGPWFKAGLATPRLWHHEPIKVILRSGLWHTMWFRSVAHDVNILKNGALQTNADK